MKFLTKLKYFYIFGNNFIKFPKILLSINSLTHIHCYSSKVKYFPLNDVRKMPNLIQINNKSVKQTFDFE